MPHNQQISYTMMKFLLGAVMLLFTSSTSLSAQANPGIPEAVNAFLKTLQPEQLEKTVYDFKDSLRYKWTNLPIGMVPRPGIGYGSLSDESRMAFHRVLSALLSSQGYLKTTSIMQLDDILNDLYQQSFDEGKINASMLKRMQDLKWAHGNFFISVWGKPGKDAAWGINFGGHHLALNYTSDGKKGTMSPYFVGTDPSEVKFGKYAGWRVLSKEEDYGFLLVNSLNGQQKSKAILDKKVPQDIITSPQSSQRITEYYGIAGKELDQTQKTFLKLIIMEYVHNFEHNKAHAIMDKIEKTGLDMVYFCWIGSQENNKAHYYIIHGPDFLIEYDNVGFQNDGNHIHAIFRENGNDFGEDLLKQHYSQGGH